MFTELPCGGEITASERAAPQMTMRCPDGTGPHTGCLTVFHLSLRPAVSHLYLVIDHTWSYLGNFTTRDRDEGGEGVLWP